MTEIERFLGRNLSSWAGNGRSISSSALVYLDLLRLPVVVLQRVIAVNPNMKTMFLYVCICLSRFAKIKHVESKCGVCIASCYNPLNYIRTAEVSVWGVFMSN